MFYIESVNAMKAESPVETATRRDAADELAEQETQIQADIRRSDAFFAALERARMNRETREEWDLVKPVAA